MLKVLESVKFSGYNPRFSKATHLELWFPKSQLEGLDLKKALKKLVKRHKAILADSKGSMGEKPLPRLSINDDVYCAMLQSAFPVAYTPNQRTRSLREYNYKFANAHGYVWEPKPPVSWDEPMLPAMPPGEQTVLLYKNAKGNLSFRHVRIKKLTPKYLIGEYEGVYRTFAQSKIEEIYILSGVGSGTQKVEELLCLSVELFPKTLNRMVVTISFSEHESD